VHNHFLSYGQKAYFNVGSWLMPCYSSRCLPTWSPRPEKHQKVPSNKKLLSDQSFSHIFSKKEDISFGSNRRWFEILTTIFIFPIQNDLFFQLSFFFCNLYYFLFNLLSTCDLLNGKLFLFQDAFSKRNLIVFLFAYFHQLFFL